MVFDPRTQKQVRLNQLPDDVDAADFEFAGVYLIQIIDKYKEILFVICVVCWFLTLVVRLSSPRKAVGMARGNINPLNQAVMDTYSPSKVRFSKT